MMKAGFAFRFADGTDDHFWFVVSDPTRDPFLLVSVMTLRFAGDQSCLLDVGDHPFIQHPSRIAYEYSMAVSTERFAAMLARAEIVEQVSASNDLLNRVWDGAQRTRLLKFRHKQILVDQQLILP